MRTFALRKAYTTYFIHFAGNTSTRHVQIRLRKAYTTYFIHFAIIHRQMRLRNAYTNIFLKNVLSVITNIDPISKSLKMEPSIYAIFYDNKLEAYAHYRHAHE
jgi:hypothetical protein